MSSDRAALLAAVLASPDDDTPRLVYADFLDDTGDPARAEFIRLEVEADRRPIGSPERMAFEERTSVLLRANLHVWNRDLPGWLGNGARVFYRRGFPYELECEYERFATSAAELFDAAPIQAVQLTAARFRSEFRWADVVRPECLARVRRLGLSPFVGGPDSFAYEYTPPPAAHLCQLPYLTGLRVLDVGMASVVDDWVVQLAARFRHAAFADTLDELLMPDNAITDAGAMALAAAQGLGRLTRLDLRNNRISPIGWEPLAARFGSRLVV